MKTLVRQPLGVGKKPVCWNSILRSAVPSSVRAILNSLHATTDGRARAVTVSATHFEKLIASCATVRSSSAGLSPICPHTASAAPLDCCSEASRVSQASRNRAALGSLVRANRTSSRKSSRLIPSAQADAIVPSNARCTSRADSFPFSLPIGSPLRRAFASSFDTSRLYCDVPTDRMRIEAPSRPRELRPPSECLERARHAGRYICCST